VSKLRSALAEGLAQAVRGELTNGPEAVADVHKFLRTWRESNKNSE
jgi:hypothetical protein